MDKVYRKRTSKIYRSVKFKLLKIILSELFPHLIDIHRKMAKFINCSATDLFCIPNATMGLNIVFRSL